MTLEYPGGSEKVVFKDERGFMARRLRARLGDRDIEGIRVAKLRKSKDLRPNLLH